MKERIGDFPKIKIAKFVKKKIAYFPCKIWLKIGKKMCLSFSYVNVPVYCLYLSTVCGVYRLCVYRLYLSTVCTCLPFVCLPFVCLPFVVSTVCVSTVGSSTDF